MEDKKYTPGEWKAKIVRWHPDGPLVGFIIVAGKKDIVSLNVNTKSLPTDPNTIEKMGEYAEKMLSYEECEANAELIANAPALKEENEQLKERIKDLEIDLQYWFNKS